MGNCYDTCTSNCYNDTTCNYYRSLGLQHLILVLYETKTSNSNVFGEYYGGFFKIKKKE